MASPKLVVLSRRSIFLVAVVFILCIFSLVLNYYLRVLPTTGGLQNEEATVILDAGHGGVDSGASFEDVAEKSITLDVVLRMRDYLEQRGIVVELTRESDVDLGGELTKGRHRRDLQARLNVIDRGQIAVSIHVNTIGDSSEQGAVVFYARNSVEGKKLAESILAEVGKVQQLNFPQPIPRSNLYLLRASKIPVALVELGFISNSEDRNKLKTEKFRQECAEAVSKGIINYLN